MKTMSVFIKDILDSPPTNSGLKRKDVYLGEDTENLIPVYSASQDEDAIFGWVKKESKWKKYNHVLTWNKDGSSGNVFYREDEFVPYEKVKILKIKPEFGNVLNYRFLKYVIENKLLSLGFGFGFKCSMERVLKVPIEIPIDHNSKFDLNEQKRLAERYEKLQNFREGMENLYNEIMELKISLDGEHKTKKIGISEIFKIEKGSAKYTRRYMLNHGGKYPVYSSQTINEGIISYLDSYDYDERCLTWTTDGIHAGTVFYRDGQFSMTTHCGALIQKEEVKEKIDLEYVFFQLKTNLKDYATGEGNKRITVERIKKVSINIPIKRNRKYDIEKQEALAKKYRVIENIRKNLQKEFKQIIESKIKLLA